MIRSEIQTIVSICEGVVSRYLFGFLHVIIQKEYNGQGQMIDDSSAPALVVV